MIPRDTSATAGNPTFKAVGICLAVGSGLFIGTSFVLKKKGLLQSNKQHQTNPGEGFDYLKNWTWWTGMTLMIIGEVANFVAYAFTDAILVTPLGALTVVVAYIPKSFETEGSAVGSSLFLKERLSFVGKVACALCLLGASIIVVNAPSQKAVTSIQQMQSFAISVVFLPYAGTLILISAVLALWAAPRYGNKTMFVYLSICSLIGSLSVVATQGLGAAIVAQAQGKPQFNQWFLYVLLVFVVCTLLVEIVYLNKALNIFNTSIVTPTYYVYFTSATILSSAVLFRGFGSSNPTIIGTVVLGFLVICCGVILLQLAKAADKVSDVAQLSGDLNDVTAITDLEKADDEPGADAIRGALSIRRYSTRRKGRSNTGESTATGTPVHLSSRSNRRNRKDGSFVDSPTEWSTRSSTIREVVPEEDEPRSSVQFNPDAPVTHIYPPRRTSPVRYDSDDHVEEVEHSRPRSSSLIPGPGSQSEPTKSRPTPRQGNIQKQFSFSPRRKHRQEEEMVGLVEAGRNEASMAENDDKDNALPPSEHSEGSDSETVKVYGRSGLAGKLYDEY